MSNQVRADEDILCFMRAVLFALRPSRVIAIVYLRAVQMIAATDHRSQPSLSAALEASNLASWYASKSHVRRLWAIDVIDAILIVVKIEPTVDGYDALPIWFAKSAEWSEELASTLRRPVRLEMLGTPSRVETLSTMSGALITEIYWREEYCE